MIEELNMGKIYGKCMLCGDDIIISLSGDPVTGGIIIKYPNKLMCYECKDKISGG